MGSIDHGDLSDAKSRIGIDYSAKTHIHGIKDHFHGNIKIYPHLQLFIDTPEFQRLRDIKQLGATTYVWPCTTHTRFEHSLGVAFLARKMATHLQTIHPELGISDRDIGCVEIAGLCHDLGHGPWSHVFDNLFIPTALPGVSWKHEDGSEMMFDYLIRDNEVPMPKDDQNFIKALIAGEHSRTPGEKVFLFDIIANKRNGLDVDKFDYLRRDSLHSSHPINLDLERLIDSARVLQDQIVYNIKDVNLVYDFFCNRFSMHKNVYNHKTTKAIEYMIIDALLAADPYLKIAQRVFKAEEYINTTDHIMSQIKNSLEPELAEARAILRAISKRELYRHVDFKTIEWPLRDIFRRHVTSEKIVERARSVFSKSDDVQDLQVSDVIVNFSTRSYGMREHNPVDHVLFYSKRNPTQCNKADRGVITSVLPKWFAEDVLNIYTKKAKHVAAVQAGYRAILNDLQNDENLTLNEEEDSFSAPPKGDDPSNTAKVSTSVGLGCPSTPPKARAFRRTASIKDMGGEKDSTPFSNNAFTTLPVNLPPSPSQGRNSKSIKRKLGENFDSENNPTSKQRK
ncbi:hypothetical protein D9619_012736 [Psilocybe cf. subviscida]|uniref:HD/PDEase domain-containing protein n=1 Tax=Psilocybe cf. subviscida TaxID=2480587 RepID=A0A8H5AQV4_9AGAR|nr:hypothetical protein D9619_012736 [Psilocybe cf. subviscida]